VLVNGLAKGNAPAPSVGAATCHDDSVPGRLDPEQIQQVVRSHYGEFHRCYVDALGRNPDAGGKVTVRCVIDAQGTVTRARVQEATLADCEAVRCILRGFRELSFPPPNGGTVGVVYPILFAPG
jgi:TonB family protein